VQATGITQTPAAFSQAQFDSARRSIDENGANLAVPRRTEGGTGGGPVWTNTVQSQVAQERGLVANGANATRLAPAQFESDYTGHLLDQDFHLQNPSYGESHIDFHA
jgi:hypothetical protein